MRRVASIWNPPSAELNAVAIREIDYDTALVTLASEFLLARFPAEASQNRRGEGHARSYLGWQPAYDEGLR